MLDRGARSSAKSHREDYSIQWPNSRRLLTPPLFPTPFGSASEQALVAAPLYRELGQARPFPTNAVNQIEACGKYDQRPCVRV